MTDRRRSVMQPMADPTGNVRSGIPMPASTTKKTAPNLRMSLAGPALRTLPPVHIAPGTNPRHSVFQRSQNSNPLLMSTSKPNYGRTPLNSNTRQGLMWGPGAPSNGQPMKDTRPLRERPYQLRMRQDILAWLQNTGYDISMPTLANITGKDFRSIFQHLVLLLDPMHPFDSKNRFEDEFIPALKALRYPYVGQIDAKWLAAPASMHSWPILLGMLHWLTEMGKAREHYLGSGHPTLQISSDVPEVFDNPHHHQALTFDYYSDAYGIFLTGSDVFEEQDRAFEHRYNKKNEKISLELEEKRVKLHQAKAEYEKLISSPAPIEKLRKDNHNLRRDREKFQECLKRFEARKKGLIETIAYEKAEIAKRESELESLRNEQSKLADVVKVQNLSPEEVIRMNSDHESLSRNLEDLKHRIAESHKHVMSLEVAVTHRADAAEQALDAYTSLLSSLGLFPPLPPPWQDIDLTLELNTAASNPTQLLGGADIRRVTRPTLSSIAESKRGERADVESERIKVDNELDQLIVDCENLQDEITELEKKVIAINDQAEDLREATQRDALESNKEAERLQKELAQARTAALANGMSVKSRLQALQFDYREQVDKVSRLREDTIRAIIKNSHEMAIFKEEVSEQLRHLKEFAEEN